MCNRVFLDCCIDIDSVWVLFFNHCMLLGRKCKILRGRCLSTQRIAECRDWELQRCIFNNTEKKKKSSLSSSEQAASLQDIKPTEIHLWCHKSNLPSISSFLRETLMMSESASQILRLYLLTQTPKSAELSTLLDCESDRLKESPSWAEGAIRVGWNSSAPLLPGSARADTHFTQILISGVFFRHNNMVG